MNEPTHERTADGTGRQLHPGRGRTLMYRDHSVGVVVPAYNEEEFVGRVIDTAPGFVDRIYAVDDASTDGTWAEIERRTAPRPTATPRASPVADGGAAGGRVVPIRHERNRGVGAAIRTGYERALAEGIDVVAVMAGDGQMDPDQLDRLVAPLVEGRAGYAKGNRLNGRTDAAEMPAWRLFGNLTLTLLTRVASGYWEMSDPQNGYTAISIEALEAIDLDTLYEGYGFTNDLLVALNARGVRIADVAMPARYGTEESGIVYRSFVPTLSSLLVRAFARRLALRYGREGHPIAVLAAGGAFAVATGIGLSIYTLGAIVRGRSDAGRPLAVAVLAGVGLWSLLTGVLLDRRENRGMVAS